ncbi:MAG: deoxyguanosinetriphosphate triphosphohydrolase [Chloroflexi bacterium RBG_16_58_8]|nr:MAG: deoxyguanosinetriphosphate triphosphohydrolase [Chloroflexi bacterium RBG_16_58_8]
MIEQLNIRQLTEEREEALSPHAVKSRLSRGRQKYEAPDPVRTAFQRDRDRIIHSKSFRRLKHKTQVFIAPPGDHYVTRLTHTLEVAQIARTIARALNLNEDLTEAIALGHDLGHTPFGHIGEDVLNELHPEGFKHNEQSLRVVDLLEKDGQGLNLTWEVRDGIARHSKSGVGILGEDWGEVGTLEGEVVKIADAVGWLNHDIGDAVRAGILSVADLPPEAVSVLGGTHSERVNTLVCDIIASSWDVRVSDIIKDRPAIRMSKPVLAATNVLRDFLFNGVYIPLSSRAEAKNARKVVRFLYRYFNAHEDKLPPEYRLRDESTERRAVDYIAGMTDNFAESLAGELRKEGEKQGSSKGR